MKTTTGESIYSQMINTKPGRKPAELVENESRLAVCPDMGGRIFAEVRGISMHRIDLNCVADPTCDFNNFGGGNFWPAPEGGKFGFNYEGDEWRVQPAINNQPFEIVSVNETSVELVKSVRLVNRMNVVVSALMRRRVHIIPLLDCFENYSLSGCVSYRTVDSFESIDDLPADKGLIAAWTLEQFDASETTTAFCVVKNPENAINFDYYDHPGERISYYEKGFTYRTDGGKPGQIGVKKTAAAELIGSYDPGRGVVCVRINESANEGTWFNIADNEQPQGPYSAADNYSIYNSDPDMMAYELETVGSAIVEDGFVKGSNLVSLTCFALFKEPGDTMDFAASLLGSPIAHYSPKA